MLRDLFSLFPAYAGVIRHLEMGAPEEASFPRIRGGDPHIDEDKANNRFFSPHTRG